MYCLLFLQRWQCEIFLNFRTFREEVLWGIGESAGHPSTGDEVNEYCYPEVRRWWPLVVWSKYFFWPVCDQSTWAVKIEVNFIINQITCTFWLNVSLLYLAYHSLKCLPEVRESWWLEMSIHDKRLGLLAVKTASIFCWSFLFPFFGPYRLFGVGLDSSSCCLTVSLMLELDALLSALTTLSI